MDRSWIKTLYKPRLVTPIFVQGLSFPSQLSSRVISLLLERLNPSKFAELYSPYFPDYAIAGADGLCSLPRCEFFFYNEVVPSIVLLLGSAQILSEGALANYEIFTEVLNYARMLGCRTFISYGGFKAEKAESNIYIAATSGRLASRIVEELGGNVFSHGKISGSIGLLLGLANSRGLRGVCILKPLDENIPPELTAKSIFNYILKIIERKKELIVD